jgi:hypothetical protein
LPDPNAYDRLPAIKRKLLEVIAPASKIRSRYFFGGIMHEVDFTSSSSAFSMRVEIDATHNFTPLYTILKTRHDIIFETRVNKCQ